VLDAYTVEDRLYDIADQVIVLQTSDIFDLEFIVEMAYSELGISLAYKCFDVDFACER